MDKNYNLDIVWGKLKRTKTFSGREKYDREKTVLICDKDGLKFALEKSDRKLVKVCDEIKRLPRKFKKEIKEHALFNIDNTA